MATFLTWEFVRKTKALSVLSVQKEMVWVKTEGGLCRSLGHSLGHSLGFHYSLRKIAQIRIGWIFSGRIVGWSKVLINRMVDGKNSVVVEDLAKY
jgi:hypothetical protein